MPGNKQHTPEFDSCAKDVMKQGHDKNSAFAICTKSFKDAGKPLYVGEAETQKLHLFSESIKLDGNKVSGVAIHPKRIFHPEEGMTHVYLKEELELAAPTLVGKPFGIDHCYVLPPPNVITQAYYDHKENGVAFEGLVDDKVAEQIRNKAFKGLSIELDWFRPGGKVEFVDGVAARNFELTSVHFLKHFPPGDRDAFVKLWNGIMEQLVASPPQTIDQRVEALENQIQRILNQINVINAKLDVLTGQHHGSSPSAIGESVHAEPSQTIGGKQNVSEGFKPKTLEGRIVFLETMANMKEQPMSKEDIEAKIKDLEKQLDVLKEEEAKITAEADPKKQEIWAQQDSLRSELEAYRRALSFVIAGVSEAQGNAQGNGQSDEREQLQKAAKARAEKYGIGVKTDGHLTKPNEFKDIPDDQFADPVNYRYPVDKEHADAALKYFNQPDNRQAGGYTHEEAVKIMEKIVKACLAAGVEVAYQPEDAVYKGLPEDVKAKLKGYEKPGESTDIVSLRKKLVETEAELANVQKEKQREVASLQDKYSRFAEAIKGTIPALHNWKSWHSGPQMMIREQLRVLRDFGVIEKVPD